MRAALTLLLINACLFLSTCSPAPSLLELVQSAGTLRVVTRNASTTHYLGVNGPTGLEYDLAKEFAEYLGVELHIYYAAEFRDILRDVRDWRADMAAAGLTITESRKSNYLFSLPYQKVDQLLIYRMGKRRPRTIDDIIGAHLAVTGGSSFVETLLALQLEYPDLHWSESNQASSVEELLQLVAKRELDFTVADSTDYEINRNFFPELRKAFELSNQEHLGWAFRKSTDTSLLDAANTYLSMLESNGELQELKDKYFGHNHSLDYVGTRQFIRHVRSRLYKYRTLFEQAADATGLDWQLLAALSYQESYWNPKAVSPTGVRGIMMLTKPTAGQMGVKDRTDPTEAIMGGARYFKRMKDKIPERIPDPDRTWFAMAAYNVGFMHLEDARIITQSQGLNPDLWEDVRIHLPLLAQQRWFSKARRGYARGWEPVIYVDNIRSYHSVLEWAMSDRNPSARWLNPPYGEDLGSAQSGSGEVSALP